MSVFLYIYLCTACMSVFHGGQNSASGSLKLELYTVMNRHVVAEYLIQVLLKINQCSYLISHLSSSS